MRDYMAGYCAQRERGVANLDTITTIPKAVLSRRLTTLSAEMLASVERAWCFAVGLA